MKWFGLCLALFTLSSCATHTASHEIANNTINQITALEQSIDEKCTTDAIKTQINVIKSQIKAINDACDTEKAEIKADKIKWQTAFWALFLVVGVFSLKKIIK
jgi:CRISPR/Cas system CSM-associated protein Csm2 small subunit